MRLHDASSRRQELWASRELSEAERLEIKQLSTYIDVLYQASRAANKGQDVGQSVWGFLDGLMRSNRGPGSQSEWIDEHDTGGRVTRFHRRSMNYRPHTIGGQSSRRDETDDSSWGVRRRTVDAVLVDLLAARGWHTLKAGATGGSRGKPTKGVTRADRIAAAVKAEGWSRAKIRRLLGRGAPSANAKLRQRPELAKVVASLLAHPRPLNVAALAKWIGCNPSTLYALRIRGEKLLEAAAPRRIDDLPWCFAQPGALRCSRGHLTYSPEPAAWIGHKCGHGHTCNELLQLAQDPNSNVIPLRGEAPMFLTDDQMALDAERLGTLTDRLDEERREIAAIAERLQARFPTDRVLAQAIEEFIQTTLGGRAVSEAA